MARRAWETFFPDDTSGWEAVVNLGFEFAYLTEPTENLFEERFIHDGDKVVLDFARTNPGSLILNLSKRYLWADAVDHVLAQENLYDGATPTGIEDGDRVYWMLADRQGSTRDLLDRTGTHIHDSGYYYDPFGQIDAGNTSYTRYLYAQMQFDTAVGMHYAIHRWYDPALGRWITEDPIGFAGDPTNPYRYVDNSPTNGVDPWGLEDQFGVAGSFFGTLYAGVAGIGKALSYPGRFIPGTSDFWARKDAALQEWYNRSNIGGTGWQTMSEYGSEGGALLIGAGMARKASRATQLESATDVVKCPPARKSTGPRPGSISGNPANKLIETGIPTKDGGWAKRWIRMSDDDYGRWLGDRFDFYQHVDDVARRLRLSPEEAHKFQFEQMQKWRASWLDDFLHTRTY